MKRKTMVTGLKAMVLVLAAMAACFFFVFLPQMGSAIKTAAPEYAWAFWPCLIWAWVFSLPVWIAAFPAWHIFGTLAEKGNAFCRENAHRFHLIGYCALAAGLIFLAGMLILACKGAGSAPLAFVITPLVVLAGSCFSFACHVMGHLVMESADLQEENQLTI